MVLRRDNKTSAGFGPQRLDLIGLHFIIAYLLLRAHVTLVRNEVDLLAG